MPNLSIFFLFLLLSIRNTVAESDEEKNFFRECPVSRCSNDGPEVKYPLRLNSSRKLCGVTGLELSCSGDQTILALPSAAFTVTAIDYSKGWITTRYLTPRHTCPLGNLSIMSNPMFLGNGNNTFFSGTGFTVNSYDIILLNCSERVIQNNERFSLAGPISCLGGADGYVYAAYTFLSDENMPSYCTAIATSLAIPIDSYKEVGKELLVDAFSEGIFTWWWPPSDCFACERKGRNCWLSLMGNLTCSSVRHGAYRLVQCDNANGDALFDFARQTRLTRKEESYIFDTDEDKLTDILFPRWEGGSDFGADVSVISHLCHFLQLKSVLSHP